MRKQARKKEREIYQLMEDSSCDKKTLKRKNMRKVSNPERGTTAKEPKKRKGGRKKEKKESIREIEKSRESKEQL